MFSDTIYEIRQKLKNPLADLPLIDQKKALGLITHANYARLKYLLYFLSFFSLILLVSDIVYFEKWHAKNLIEIFIIADISLLMISIAGLLMIHRKRMPGIDFQQQMITVFLLYGAIWIGVISGMDYKQSYLTLVAGIFIISSSFILSEIFHAIMLAAIYTVFTVLHYPHNSEYHDAFTEFFIIPACMVLAWVFGKILYKHKVESIQKEKMLREYAENLQETVTQRTAELKTKNDNLIREINSKETIQSQLIASEELFKKLLYQSADAIAIFDTHGKILQWNIKIEEYTGIHRRDAIDKVYWELLKTPIKNTDEASILEEKVKNYIDQIRHNNTTTSKINLRHSFINNSNRSRYIETKIFPIYLHKQTLVASIGRDITQQYEHETHLRKAQQKAERANVAKSDFLANISHDLRSPLNSIAGFSQILKLKPNIPEEKKQQYLSIIYDNGQYLLQLIHALIDLTQLQSGNIKTEEQAFYIDEFMKEVESLVVSEKTLRSPNVKITRNCNADHLLIKTDRTKLLQIFTNLLSNAIKFTSEGEIQFGCKIEGQKLHGYVEDTGTGINDLDLQKIFNRFFSAHATQEKNEQGKGLGLAIVKGYIDLLGGTINVKSERGKGTRFDLTIPVTITEKEQSETIQPAPTPGKNVLIIDSDAESAEFVGELLDQYQLNIKRATKFEEALPVLNEQPCDLLLINIFRENTLLKTQIEQVRKQLPNLPVIGYTALPQSKITEDLSTMVDVILFKPINAKLLLQKAAKLLNGRTHT